MVPHFLHFKSCTILNPSTVTLTQWMPFASPTSSAWKCFPFDPRWSWSWSYLSTHHLAAAIRMRMKYLHLGNSWCMENCLSNWSMIVLVFHHFTSCPGGRTWVALRSIGNQIMIFQTLNHRRQVSEDNEVSIHVNTSMVIKQTISSTCGVEHLNPWELKQLKSVEYDGIKSFNHKIQRNQPGIWWDPRWPHDMETWSIPSACRESTWAPKSNALKNWCLTRPPSSLLFNLIMYYIRVYVFSYLCHLCTAQYLQIVMPSSFCSL